MATPSPFSTTLFDFLRDLRANNNKPWFEANRQRYEEDVLEPCKTFVLAVRPALREISEHFIAEPRVQGGSLFRIHANLRFRPDAPPYKTHSGIQFRHAAGKDAHAPGFYLHLEPSGDQTEETTSHGGPFIGMGTWRPDKDSLRKIREAIVDDPSAWTSSSQHAPFTARFSLAGEQLKRGPKGFDVDHPMIEDLKRKDFIGVTPLTESQVIGDGFVENFAEACRSGAPFMKWLCGAVGEAF